MTIGNLVAMKDLQPGQWVSYVDGDTHIGLAVSLGDERAVAGLVQIDGKNTQFTDYSGPCYIIPDARVHAEPLSIGLNGHRIIGAIYPDRKDAGIYFRYNVFGENNIIHASIRSGLIYRPDSWGAYQPLCFKKWTLVARQNGIDSKLLETEIS